MTHTITQRRPLLHQLANEFGVLLGTAELLAGLPDLSEQQRLDATVMLDALRNLAALLATAGAEVEPHQLAAELVHELRTPLQALLGFTELLQSGEVQDDCLVGMATAGRHMAGLLDDCLADTVIAADARVATTSAAAAVGQAVLLASPLARAAQVHVVQVARTEADVVYADPRRLCQVVLNLLTNAINCCPPGSEVHTVVSRRSDSVTIACQDQGPGLTAAEISELLSRPRGVRAHGLGLLITCDLVEDMDGFVSVQSSPGWGSCFSIALPATPELRASQPAAPDLMT